MRPWVLLRQADIPFEEVMLRFDSMEPGSAFKRSLQGLSPTAKVPVLVDEGFAVWDTLAIAEYVAEKHPAKALWPANARQRARARSVCAEMHAGFGALRQHLTMNIEARLPEVGERVLRDEAGVRADVARVTALWSDCLHASGGPLLFGEFTIADAYFAPVATRFVTYGVPLPPAAAAYVEAVLGLPAVRAWEADALAEHDFVAFDEPYRQAPASR